MRKLAVGYQAAATLPQAKPLLRQGRIIRAWDDRRRGMSFNRSAKAGIQFKTLDVPQSRE